MEKSSSFQNITKVLRKVISGGQTGVDQAGLFAAQKAGLKTGGWAPLGWRTQDGANLALGQVFGLRETQSENYKVRTEMNVHDADATIRIASNFGSPGERCTMNAIKHFQKPSLDIHYNKESGNFDPPAINIAEWVIRNGFEILNVAGNAEKTCPGIGRASEVYLTTVFLLVKRRQK